MLSAGLSRLASLGLRLVEGEVLGGVRMARSNPDFGLHSFPPGGGSYFNLPDFVNFHQALEIFLPPDLGDGVSLAKLSALVKQNRREAKRLWSLQSCASGCLLSPGSSCYKEETLS